MMLPVKMPLENHEQLMNHNSIELSASVACRFVTMCFNVSSSANDMVTVPCVCWITFHHRLATRTTKIEFPPAIDRSSLIQKKNQTKKMSNFWRNDKEMWFFEFISATRRTILKYYTLNTAQKLELLTICDLASGQQLKYYTSNEYKRNGLIYLAKYSKMPSSFISVQLTLHWKLSYPANLLD